MNDDQKTQIDVVRHEVNYRREKQWKIFSWTATLLLAAIGGTITLAGKHEFVFPLWPQRSVMAFALVVIAVYACLWIHENIKFESCARDELLRKLADVGISVQAIPKPSSAPTFGYSATLVLLVIGSCLILLSLPAQPTSRSSEPVPRISISGTITNINGESRSGSAALGPDRSP